ncbi:MAG: DUF2797 domain-containing protein [Thermoprotei archaeon]|nr:MAG: DUF2797 domain-containing protein [Thermoprotei archaeon]
MVKNTSGYIPRIFLIEARFFNRRVLGLDGLDRFLSLKSIGEDVVEEYRSIFRGIIVQDPGAGSLDIIVAGDHIKLLSPTNEYCHWHNGYLDKRDNPLERIYCLKKPLSSLGYCREHNDSLRAIYTRCFSGGGIYSLGACKRLDDVFGKTIMYSLYLLDYGLGVKVGTTRSWRIYDRIAEQPHVVAARLMESSSAYTIREYEMRIGELHGLSEKPHRRSLRDVLSYPPRYSLKRLLSVIEKIGKILNIPLPDQRTVFRILPSIDIAYYNKAKNVEIKDVEGIKLEVMEYWAGYLLVSKCNGNEYYLIKSKNLLHRNCLGVIR